MSLFYVKNGEIYIPDEINPELIRLAKYIVKTCRLTFKVQMKTTSLTNAVKGGDIAVMHDLMQKCFAKNRKMYNMDMELSGAKLDDVDDGFFADKTAEFYQAQLKILIDFACINTVIEARMFPLMTAACEKTLGKNINELKFFSNQTEILAPPAEEEEEDGDAEKAGENE